MTFLLLLIFAYLLSAHLMWQSGSNLKVALHNFDSIPARYISKQMNVRFLSLKYLSLRESQSIRLLEQVSAFQNESVNNRSSSI